VSGSRKFEEYEKALHQAEYFKISGAGVTHIKGVIVKIAGTGKLEDDRLAIAGSGVICGSISLQSVKASGSLRIEGDLEAKSLSISGSCLIEGSLTSEQVISSGSCKILGDTKIESLLKSSGSFKAGRIKVGRIVASGSFSTDDIDADDIRIEGTIDVSGNIICNTLYLRLKNRSQIKGHVRAEHVEIEGEYTSKLGILGLVKRSRGVPQLKVKRIEAGEIVLREIHLICEEVKADRISIGPDTIVEGQILYRENIDVHPSAQLSREPKRTA